MDPKALYLQQATAWLADVDSWANASTGGGQTNSGGNSPPPPPPPWPPKDGEPE